MVPGGSSGAGGSLPRRGRKPLAAREDVGHGVTSGLRAREEAGGLERAPREDPAVLGRMRDPDALAGPAEEELVLPDDVPDPQRMEGADPPAPAGDDRKSTRLNSSH